MKNFLIILVSIVFLIGNFLTGKEDENRIVYLDVGQGDSILIQIDGVNLLIDDGPDDLVVYGLDQFLKPWDRTIDYLIITHPHDDHIGGSWDMLSRFKILNILINPVCYNSATYNYLFNQGNVHFVGNLFEIAMGEQDIEIINPLVYLSDVSKREVCKTGSAQRESLTGNINNDSLIVILNFKGEKYLFMGDAEKDMEHLIVTSASPILKQKIMVLKAGHHCSKTSSSEEFLLYSQPQLIICSVGKDNKFGHPSKETIERIEKLQIPYLETMERGSIGIDLESGKITTTK